MLIRHGVHIFVSDTYFDIYEPRTELNDHEKAYLIKIAMSVVDKHRLKMKKLEEHWITEYAKQEAAIRTPFEKFGCPDSQ